MNTDFIFCIVGKSGTGKTTLVKNLEKLGDYNVIHSFTTRKPRHDNEYGHIFVNKDVFPEIRETRPDDIVAYTHYNGNHYWADRLQFKGVSLYVVDFPGIQLLKKSNMNMEIKTIYLHADYHDLLKRLRLRYPDEIQVLNRMRFDELKFNFCEIDFFVNTTLIEPDKTAREINSYIKRLTHEIK